MLHAPKAAAGTVATGAHSARGAAPATSISDEHPLVSAVDDALYDVRSSLLGALLVEPVSGVGGDASVVGHLALSLATQHTARSDLPQALQVLTAAIAAVQAAADDAVRLSSRSLTPAASDFENSEAVATSRAIDALRCLHVDLVSLFCVLEGRHERHVSAAAAAAAAKQAALSAAAAQSSATGGKRGSSPPPSPPPTASSRAAGATARSLALKAPGTGATASAAVPMPVPGGGPNPPPSALVPPAAALAWSGEHRGWQAIVHLAAVDLIMPDGADTPGAAATLIAKAAKLLADASTDEARAAAASVDGTSASSTSAGSAAPTSPPVLIARASTSMTFALPAAAAAAAAAGSAPGSGAAAWVLLGKPFGSGTAVTTANMALRGTGVPVSAVAASPQPGTGLSAPTITVTGLTPNTRYNFAWGWSTVAASLPGKPLKGIAKLAGGISPSTAGLVAATSFPLDLVWARLAVAAVRAGDPTSFAAALRRVSVSFLASAAPRPACSEQSSSPAASICLKVCSFA
jgi:hypothetical protein